jgi:hypothetical protein
MSNRTTNAIIEELAASIEIPESAWEKADSRYQDLGEWFNRADGGCVQFQPHIYPQGSFRLGTVIRSDEYDLDVGCRLRRGITKQTHTQKQLKMLVGRDVEAYRVARGIKETLEEMHRCWRLPYADTLKFHMDIVPSIPEEASRRQMLREIMAAAGTSHSLAEAVASWAGAITDKRLQNYEVISVEWRISNSEGYALWFESRMKLAQTLVESQLFAAKAAQVDPLPTSRWNLPLQKSVKLLKRHRDVMFQQSPDAKPISIIITTLAAAAYQGETDFDDALARILANMGGLVRATKPRVPNPVNPAEDFADKWADPKCKHLNLEQHFWDWLEQAQNDFRALWSARDIDLIAEQADERFAAQINTDRLRDTAGLSTATISAPKVRKLTEAPARPWRSIS